VEVGESERAAAAVASKIVMILLMKRKRGGEGWGASEFELFVSRRKEKGAGNEDDALPFPPFSGSSQSHIRKKAKRVAGKATWRASRWIAAKSVEEIGSRNASGNKQLPWPLKRHHPLSRLPILATPSPLEKTFSFLRSPRLACQAPLMTSRERSASARRSRRRHFQTGISA